eukprot:TRINITY_DN56808_c0_g1_i1.p1 TRINITY_DN56808_c0_g1~~TRINITY_DN56808_c0_g1_i1.p1  ORF type:complete len:558 (-),score=69.10 TRINITY_DN56808_c0_g1_i1:615-2240(-)
MGSSSRQLWPAVLELVDRGLKLIFKDHDLPKARHLLADALDLAQGKWDCGNVFEASTEVSALLITAGFPSSSLASVHHPNAATKPPVEPPAAGLARAFGECPLGVAAIYRALALAHLADTSARASQESSAQALAIAQRFHHLGYGFLIKLYNEGPSRQDPEYVDLALWPITGEEWETERDHVTRSLKELGGPTSAARASVPKTARISGISIALVTVCAYPKESMLPHLAASVHKTYTKRHGYTYIHHRDEDDHLSSGRPKAWTKIRALHEALEDGRWDWVLWADCDIYFMDLETTLDSLLLRYASQTDRSSAESSMNMAKPARDDLNPRVNLLITEDAQALNTAIFFMRRSTWSLQLLRQAWGMDAEAAASPTLMPSQWTQASSPFIHHPWWEQPALTQQLLGDNHRRFQSMPYPKASQTSASLLVPYPVEVRIAPQMEMNSYHVISSRLIPDTTWMPGKFIMSFNGVKSATGPMTAQIVAANYYEVFCELNGLQDRCAADLRAFFKEQRSQPVLGEHFSGTHNLDAYQAAMFAPWMLQAT